MELEEGCSGFMKKEGQPNLNHDAGRCRRRERKGGVEAGGQLARQIKVRIRG